MAITKQRATADLQRWLGRKHEQPGKLLSLAENSPGLRALQTLGDPVVEDLIEEVEGITKKFLYRMRELEVLDEEKYLKAQKLYLRDL